METCKDDRILAVAQHIDAASRESRISISVGSRFLGLPDEKDAIVSREHIIDSICNVRRTIYSGYLLRPRYRLDYDVGGRLHTI